jgi:transposase-like protein
MIRASKEGETCTKSRLNQTPKKKWTILQEGLKDDNVSETRRQDKITPNLSNRWRDEAEQKTESALAEESRRRGPSKTFVPARMRLQWFQYKSVKDLQFPQNSIGPSG